MSAQNEAALHRGYRRATAVSGDHANFREEFFHDPTGSQA